MLWNALHTDLSVLALEAPSSRPHELFTAGQTDEGLDKPEKETVACFQCGEPLLRRNVRSHVGSHILRQLVGAPEGPSMKFPVRTLETLEFPACVV